MSSSHNKHKHPAGLSLAELLVALAIGSMVLVVVLAVFSRAENSAAAIENKLYDSRTPAELLQLIAEDLDKAVAPGANTKITVLPKFDEGFATSQLTIQNTITDKNDEEQVFEEIIWQAGYDNDANGLVLYRSHDGMVTEDKLLDEQRANWEKAYPFVPVCKGLTYFKVEIPRGEVTQDRWTSSTLPYGVIVTISFAQPFKTVRGTLDVPDTEKFSRTIAVDRTRRIRFEFVPSEDEEESTNEEPNEPTPSEEPNEPTPQV